MTKTCTFCGPKVTKVSKPTKKSFIQNVLKVIWRFSMTKICILYGPNLPQNSKNISCVKCPQKIIWKCSMDKIWFILWAKSENKNYLKNVLSQSSSRKLFEVVQWPKYTFCFRGKIAKKKLGKILFCRGVLNTHKSHLGGLQWSTFAYFGGQIICPMLLPIQQPISASHCFANTFCFAVLKNTRYFFIQRLLETPIFCTWYTYLSHLYMYVVYTLGWSPK